MIRYTILGVKCLIADTCISADTILRFYKRRAMGGRFEYIKYSGGSDGTVV